MSQWLEDAVIAVCASPECSHASRPLDMSDEDLWRELITCILGSQVPNWMGVAAAKQLAEQGLIVPAHSSNVEQIIAALRMPIESPRGPRHYRFPQAKARHIVTAHRTVCLLYGTLRSLVHGCSPDECRRHLVEHVAGVGLKQASLFLRNIGISSGFAILDTHVVRYMREIGLVRMLPQSITTDVYYVLESVLSRYAEQLGQPIGHVDRAIWAVMSASAVKKI